LNENISVMLLDEYGYEIMRYWDDPDEDDLQYAVVREYAEQWKHIKKIVVGPADLIFETKDYTLWNELTASRIDSLLEASGDVMVGSEPLAWELLKLKKLSDIQIMTVPILLGAGEKSYEDTGEVHLELKNHKIFENGWTYMHYEVINEKG